MPKHTGYFGGGQYFCSKCKHAHDDLSDMGKKHIKYASKQVKLNAFRDYGIK